MTIALDDARHVADLAHLGLTDAELRKLSQELDTIIASIGKIGELDLTGVRATSHAFDVQARLAPDEPHTSLTPEQALRSAPDAANGQFRVPRMRS